MSEGGDPVSLEGRITTPPGDEPKPAVVLCHPGILGDCGMEYPVVRSCADSLSNLGLVTLRFNFRGVQRSGGTRSAGREEAQDVLGALAFTRRHVYANSGRVYLLGVSFGAWMAVEALRCTSEASGIACIGLPLSLMKRSPDELRTDLRPKLFVVAENDQFCKLADLQKQFALWAPPKQLTILPDTDHFLDIGPGFRDNTDGRSSDVARIVSTWLRAQLSRPLTTIAQ